MNKARGRLRFIAVGAIVIMVAAACSSSSNEPKTFQPDDLSGQSIEVVAKWGEDSDEAPKFAQVIDLFEKQTGASVTYTSLGDDLPTVLSGRVAGGDSPDVAILPQPGLMSQFAQEGALVSIEDQSGDNVDANYAPVWRDLGTVDDTLYGVWFKASNKGTFWYNVKAFSDAGVEPPVTWEDLTAAADTVSASGVTPYAVDGGSGWVLSDWFEIIYLKSAGAEKYDQLTNHEIPWTDQSVKDALSLFADVVGNDANLAGGIDGTLQSEFPTSVSVTFSDPPGAAMVYEGDFVAGTASGEEVGATPGTDFDYFDFPSIGGSPPSVTFSGDVGVLMKDSPAGQAFLEFLATPEAANVWIPLGGYTSPNKAADLDLYGDEIARRSAEQLTTAETSRFDMSDLQPAAFGSTAGQGIWGLLQEFVRHPGDIDGVTQKLEDEATTAFG